VVYRQLLKAALGALLAIVLSVSGALADDDDRSNATALSDLVKQANAPISSILQIRLQDSYAPQFWDLNGRGNTFSIAMTMPLPKYRLLPFPPAFAPHPSRGRHPARRCHRVR